MNEIYICPSCAQKLGGTLKDGRINCLCVECRFCGNSTSPFTADFYNFPSDAKSACTGFKFSHDIRILNKDWINEIQ